MIYQELLALLQEEAKSAGFRMDRNAWFVLCDVVELHKPQEITLPNGMWGANCGHCDIGFDYPCPTIQTIQKELA